MKNKFYLFALLTTSFFISCDNNDDNSGNQATENGITINSDATSLNKRLDYTNSGVISITNTSTAKGLATQSTTDLPLVQIAEINPPTDGNGRTLQANHVAVNGNYAYVAYTMMGEAYS
ncbi:hypothetical protein [Flavobacterium zhairuonense]|uniref:hypothetical protein n=1 Tax=Flavobacterium zhairuonense TaxID=2493631 RepID=UPI001F2D2C08|nr:hypothetical protein [Flavobacterium zhairuonense]